MLNQRYTCSRINDNYLKIRRYPKIRFDLVRRGGGSKRKIVGEILNSAFKTRPLLIFFRSAVLSGENSGSRDPCKDWIRRLHAYPLPTSRNNRPLKRGRGEPPLSVSKSLTIKLDNRRPCD